MGNGLKSKWVCWTRLCTCFEKITSCRRTEGSVEELVSQDFSKNFNMKPSKQYFCVNKIVRVDLGKARVSILHFYFSKQTTFENQRSFKENRFQHGNLVYFILTSCRLHAIIWKKKNKM